MTTLGKGKKLAIARASCVCKHGNWQVNSNCKGNDPDDVRPPLYFRALHARCAEQNSYLALVRSSRLAMNGKPAIRLELRMCQLNFAFARVILEVPKMLENSGYLKFLLDALKVLKV